MKTKLKAFGLYAAVAGVAALHGYLTNHGLSIFNPQLDMIVAPLLVLLGARQLRVMAPPVKK